MLELGLKEYLRLMISQCWLVFFPFNSIFFFARFFGSLLVTFWGLKMWRKPTPSLYKYNQNFKLNNCAISKIPETNHIFKPLLNAVLYFRNLKDNATFYRKVWFSAFHCHANLICRAKFGFPQRIFNTKLFGKVQFRFPIFRRSFRQVYLKLSNRNIDAKVTANYRKIYWI